MNECGLNTNMNDYYERKTQKSFDHVERMNDNLIINQV